MIKISGNVVSHLVDTMYEIFKRDELNAELITQDILDRCKKDYYNSLSSSLYWNRSGEWTKDIVEEKYSKYCAEISLLEGFKFEYYSEVERYDSDGECFLLELITFFSKSGYKTEFEFKNVEEGYGRGNGFNGDVIIYESEDELPDDKNPRICQKCKSKDTIIESLFNIDSAGTRINQISVDVRYCTNCGDVLNKWFKK